MDRSLQNGERDYRVGDIMVYFDRVTQEYEDSLRGTEHEVNIYITPLDHWENTVAEIKADIARDSGSLTIAKGNSIRRSLGLTLADNGSKFTPNKNSYFWYNRKFKVIVEYVLPNGDRYKFSQGVFVIKSSNESNGRLKISAVDKFANLNGENKIGTVITPFTTKISAGTIYIGNLIRETLLRDMGNGYPIDPVPPLIDPYFDTEPLYADIALSEGQYYGNIIMQLADMYGADTYYDAAGHLVFQRKPTYNQPSWFMHLGYLWRYKDSDETISLRTRQTDHQFDGVNCVTVATDNSEGTIYSYTAKNKNAESPVNVEAIGERFLSPPIRYISLGDATREDGQEKCKQYAEYLLTEKTRDSVSEKFTSVYIPHFDVDKVIRYRNEDYVIDGLNIDLTNRMMNVSASNVAFMPMNWSLQSYE